MEYISGKKLKKIIKLLKMEPLDYPITLGVLDGTFRGYALVDDTADPAKALVFHNYIGFLQYTGTVPDEHESREMAEAALAYRSERDYNNVVEFAHCPESVSEILETELGKIRRYNRISWEHDKNLFYNAPSPKLSDDIAVSYIEREHFIHEFVRNECEMFWETYEVFLKKVFGTIAHGSDGEFLGVCGAVSDSGGFYEINIETSKEHRRKGIGYALAYEYIKECYRRNGLPHWDCYDYNTASQNLAEKLGFRESGRYPLVSWQMDQTS